VSIDTPPTATPPTATPPVTTLPGDFASGERTEPLTAADDVKGTFADTES
jgi:hypothetical protein